MQHVLINLILIPSIVCVISIACVILVQRIARALHVVDIPDTTRKLHSTPIPLLGGLGIFIAFWIGWYVSKDLYPRIPDIRFLGLFFSGVVLMIGGYIDDKYHMRPKYQIIAPCIAVLIALFFTIRANEITNPFGGVLQLSSILSIVISGVWLLGMMYTTKLLDGLDGLASGVTAIGTLTIAGLALATKYYQPDMALLSLILFGAILGFLFFNIHPARIFLGEGGSVWIGFMIGAFALMSGSKIATTLLVMGVPALDVAWVILRRMLKERKSPFQGDRLHLHYRLIDAGLTIPQAVGVFYLLSFAFGLSSLFLLSFQKFQALGLLLLIMVVLTVLVTKNKKARLR